MGKSEFDLQFEQRETELLVLLKEDCGGAAVDGDWLIPAVDFIASVDVENQELSRKEGRLTWMIPNEKNRKGFGFDFKQYGIYRLLVRKCIPVELNKYQSETLNNRYMVIRILEENVWNKDLQGIKEYMQKPVVLENALGIFTLNRQYSWFECTMDWNGKAVSVTAETDVNCDEKADTAMAVLFRYANDKAGFDQKIRGFAVQELLELANDWLVDDDSDDKSDEITNEMFMKYIEMSEFSVNSDGCVTLYYSDGDLFWGHSIEICVSVDGECESADIVG